MMTRINRWYRVSGIACFEYATRNTKQGGFSITTTEAFR